MVQRREELCLALQPREPIRIVGEMFWKDLQRDVSEELRVTRPEHDAHCTGAELRRDLVYPDAASHSDRHLPPDLRP
jgi:hypothetical protein